MVLNKQFYLLAPFPILDSKHTQYFPLEHFSFQPPSEEAYAGLASERKSNLESGGASHLSWVTGPLPSFLKLDPFILRVTFIEHQLGRYTRGPLL